MPKMEKVKKCQHIILPTKKKKDTSPHTDTHMRTGMSCGNLRLSKRAVGRHIVILLFIYVCAWNSHSHYFEKVKPNRTESNDLSWFESHICQRRQVKNVIVTSLAIVLVQWIRDTGTHTYTYTLLVTLSSQRIESIFLKKEHSHTHTHTDTHSNSQTENKSRKRYSNQNVLRLVNMASRDWYCYDDMLLLLLPSTQAEIFVCMPGNTSELSERT